LLLLLIKNRKVYLTNNNYNNNNNNINNNINNINNDNNNDNNDDYNNYLSPYNSRFIDKKIIEPNNSDNTNNNDNNSFFCVEDKKKTNINQCSFEIESIKSISEEDDKNSILHYKNLDAKNNIFNNYNSPYEINGLLLKEAPIIIVMKPTKEKTIYYPSLEVTKTCTTVQKQFQNSEKPSAFKRITNNEPSVIYNSCYRNISFIPDEIYPNVVSYSSSGTLISLSIVSKSFNKLVKYRFLSKEYRKKSHFLHGYDNSYKEIGSNNLKILFSNYYNLFDIIMEWIVNNNLKMLNWVTETYIHNLTHFKKWFHDDLTIFHAGKYPVKILPIDIKIREHKFNQYGFIVMTIKRFGSFEMINWFIDYVDHIYYGQEKQMDIINNNNNITSFDLLKSKMANNNNNNNDNNNNDSNNNIFARWKCSPSDDRSSSLARLNSLSYLPIQNDKPNADSSNDSKYNFVQMKGEKEVSFVKKRLANEVGFSVFDGYPVSKPMNVSCTPGVKSKHLTNATGSVLYNGPVENQKCFIPHTSVISTVRPDQQKKEIPLLSMNLLLDFFIKPSLNSPKDSYIPGLFHKIMAKTAHDDNIHVLKKTLIFHNTLILNPDSNSNILNSSFLFDNHNSNGNVFSQQASNFLLQNRQNNAFTPYDFGKVTIRAPPTCRGEATMLREANREYACVGQRLGQSPNQSPIHDSRSKACLLSHGSKDMFSEANYEPLKDTFTTQSLDHEHIQNSYQTVNYPICLNETSCVEPNPSVTGIISMNDVLLKIAHQDEEESKPINNYSRTLICHDIYIKQISDCFFYAMVNGNVILIREILDYADNYNIILPSLNLQDFSDDNDIDGVSVKNLQESADYIFPLIYINNLDTWKFLFNISDTINSPMKGEEQHWPCSARPGLAFGKDCAQKKLIKSPVSCNTIGKSIGKFGNNFCSIEKMCKNFKIFLSLFLTSIFYKNTKLFSFAFEMFVERIENDENFLNDEEIYIFLKYFLSNLTTLKRNNNFLLNNSGIVVTTIENPILSTKIAILKKKLPIIVVEEQYKHAAIIHFEINIQETADLIMKNSHQFQKKITEFFEKSEAQSAESSQPSATTAATITSTTTTTTTTSNLSPSSCGNIIEEPEDFRIFLQYKIYRIINENSKKLKYLFSKINNAEPNENDGEIYLSYKCKNILTILKWLGYIKNNQ
jgi:hypothetical protein